MTNCALCTTPIPPPADRRQARRRYCSDTCRKIAWKKRHQDQPADPDSVTGDATPTRDGVPTPASQHRCPHCHQPLAVVSVIVPAAAAHLTPPEAPMTPT